MFNKPSKLIQVTKNEFIQLMTKNGYSQQDAILQANLAMKLGSSVVIGNLNVSVKKEKS